jgi:hypothetical protein
MMMMMMMMITMRTDLVSKGWRETRSKTDDNRA